MANYQFEFTARLEDVHGPFRSLGIFIPESILCQLPSGSRVRAEGIINGHPFNLGIQSARQEGKYFVASRILIRDAKINNEQPFTVCFNLADPEKLEIPEEFEIALEQDPEANAIFNSFTTGAKRSLLHYVNSAKSQETRIKRSLELLFKMKRRELNIQKRD